MYFLVPHLTLPSPPRISGGGKKLNHQHLQAADGGGRALGPDQRPFRPDHLLHPLYHGHSGGLRDPEETEPQTRDGRFKTLVTVLGLADDPAEREAGATRSGHNRAGGRPPAKTV